MEERTIRSKAGPAFSRILMLCAGAFAVEAAYSLEEGYALPAMLATGLPETVASAMWAVGPLLGFFFQGYLGSASDRCTLSWGKRRPFIASLAACACLAMFLFPHGSFLSASVLKLGEKSSPVFVMAFTAAAFVVMDFSLDALRSPLRAYLADSVPAERSERANYTFTAFMCMGAIAGALIAGVPWSYLAGKPHNRASGQEAAATAEEGDNSQQISGQLEMVYGVTAALFVACMIFCLSSVPEKNASAPSPRVENRDASGIFLLAKPDLLESCGTLTRKYNSFTSLSALVQPSSLRVETTKDDLNILKDKQQLHEERKHEIYGHTSPLIPHFQIDPVGNGDGESILQNSSQVSGCFPRFLGNVYEDIRGMAVFSKRISTHFSCLCWVTFLSWVAYLSTILYFTSFMGEVVYEGSPQAPSGERDRELFDRGVQAGFLLMMLQDIVSVLGCISIEWISSVANTKQIFVGVLVGYTVSSLVTVLWPSILSAALLQLMAGLLYSINIEYTPYVLLSQYEVCVLCVSLSRHCYTFGFTKT